MRFKHLRLLTFICIFVVQAANADSSFQIRTDYSRAPQCRPFADKARLVAQQWYPRIDEILFGPDHPLPGTSVEIRCEPMKAIAYTDIKKNIIHISAEYVTTRSPDDLGMIVHELTHIVQHYVKLKPADVWLQEGIADYIRHRYFENDIASLAINVDQDSYRKGYKPAALFLDWLQRRDPNIIRDLNRECSQGHCDSDLFMHFCGADVDTLWVQFSTDYKNRNPKPENEKGEPRPI